MPMTAAPSTWERIRSGWRRNRSRMRCAPRARARCHRPPPSHGRPRRRSSRSCDARRCRAPPLRAAPCPNPPSRRRARRHCAIVRCRSGTRHRPRRSPKNPPGSPPPVGSMIRVRPDQLEQVVLLVASELVGELRHERLDRERARNVRDRAEPADPRVRHRLAVLGSARWRCRTACRQSPMPSSMKELVAACPRRRSRGSTARRCDAPARHLVVGIDRHLDPLDRGGVVEARG